MLQNIRNNSQGTIAKIIIGIMIVPFALFGIDSLFNSAPTSDVAIVNGQPISEVELNREMNQQMQRFVSQFGDSFDASQIDPQMLRQPALDQLIDDKILLQRALDADLRIAPLTIDQMIVNDATFQREGKFSSELFLSLLRSAGFTPLTYKKLLDNQLLINQYSNGIAASDFTTDTELKVSVSLLKQKRSGEYVVIPAEKLRDGISVTDSEIASYYADNTSSYMTPEQVSVSYILLDVKDLYTPIDESILREQYQQQLADQLPVTERHVAHILIETNDEVSIEQATARIAAIKQQIQDGADFSALAKQTSQDVGSAMMGGDLGVTTGDTFPEPFENAIANLSAGELSDPVVTDSGVHLIKVLSDKKASIASFEERRASIENSLQQDQAAASYVQLLENLKDYTFNASDLVSPAKDLGLTVQQSELFSRAGGQGVFANKKVVNAAFSADVLTDGNNSEVVELSDSSAIVVHVDKHQVATPIALAQAADQIKATLVKQKLATALSNYAEKLSGQSSLAEFNAAAQQSGLLVQSFDGVTRETSRDLDAGVAEAIFSLAPSDQLQSQQATMANGDVAVVVVSSIESGKLSDISDQEEANFSDYVARSSGQNSLFAVKNTLKAQATIER